MSSYLAPRNTPTRPLNDWQRMARYVHQLVQADAVLDTIRAVNPPVVIHAHERAIFATCKREIDGGGWQIEVRIERPEWWVPVKRSHGTQIAADLIVGLLHEWRDRPGS